MNTYALIVMVTTIVVVTLVTGYFFMRVLSAPLKPGPEKNGDRSFNSRNRTKRE